MRKIGGGVMRGTRGFVAMALTGALILSNPVSASANETVVCQPSEGQKEFLGALVPILVPIVANHLVTNAMAWVERKTRLKIESPPPDVITPPTEYPTRTASGQEGGAPCDVVAPPVEEVRPALAFLLFHVDSDRTARPVGDNFKFPVGDAVLLNVTTNMPGVLDVYNRAPSGKVTKLDSTRFADAETSFVPENGWFTFDEEAGDEVLILVFNPCNIPAEGTQESLRREFGEVAFEPVGDKSSGNGTRDDVVARLPECRAAAQRGAEGHPEALTRSYGTVTYASSPTDLGDGIEDGFVTELVLRRRR